MIIYRTEDIYRNTEKERRRWEIEKSMFLVRHLKKKDIASQLLLLRYNFISHSFQTHTQFASVYITYNLSDYYFILVVYTFYSTKLFVE